MKTKVNLLVIDKYRPHSKEYLGSYLIAYIPNLMGHDARGNATPDTDGPYRLYEGLVTGPHDVVRHRAAIKQMNLEEA